MKEYIVQATEQETIDTFEANNAPELIRCKDCIWFHKPDAETKKSCKCNYHGCVTEGDRYCWWGEKDV